MLNAIIFDVDGTLSDTENVHRVSFNRAFVAAGLDWHWDRARYRGLLRIAGGKERIGEFMDMRRYGNDLSSSERKAFIERVHKSKTRYFERFVSQGALKLRPGVAELIDAARSEGVRLAIATTTSPANVDALLKSTMGKRASDVFDAVAAGDCVVRKKPAPDVYLETLGRLELLASECLVIEDSQNGLRAATAAGLTTVVTPTAYTETEDFRGASLVVRTLNSLVEGVSPLFAGRRILASLRNIHSFHGASK